MKQPRMFSVPATEPVPLTGTEGNILRRCRYALSPDEYVDLLNEVSPARRELASPALDALERYVFNRVGPLFPTYNDVAQRDHFLPHTGLWAPVRKFDDPRVMTQLWLHTAAHEWYGHPLPVATTYNRYRQACFDGEILAVIESEFIFFQEGGSSIEGMFNPAYPSTYEALCAVGVDTPEAAFWLLHNAQFNRGVFPSAVYKHPAYTGGVAVTLHRQAAWPEHDEEFILKHWSYQRQAGYQRAYNHLWTPDRQTSIFGRQALGHAGILRYQSDLDPLEGLRAVVKSMLRVMSLDVVQQPNVDQDMAFGRIVGLFDALGSMDVNQLRALAERMPDIYDSILGEDPVQLPAPIWELALAFRGFRIQWEERLKEKTAFWTAGA